VVNPLLLLHLLDGLVNSLDLHHFLSVGNHDGLLDLTGLSLPGGLHHHPDILSVGDLFRAFLDSVHDLLVLGAGTAEVVGTAAVTLESNCAGFDGLGLRGNGKKCKCEEVFHCEFC